MTIKNKKAGLIIGLTVVIALVFFGPSILGGIQGEVSCKISPFNPDCVCDQGEIKVKVWPIPRTFECQVGNPPGTIDPPINSWEEMTLYTEQQVAKNATCVPPNSYQNPIKGEIPHKAGEWFFLEQICVDDANPLAGAYSMAVNSSSGCIFERRCIEGTDPKTNYNCNPQIFLEIGSSGQPVEQECPFQ